MKPGRFMTTRRGATGARFTRNGTAATEVAIIGILGERVRSAVLSVTICKRAWNVARRDKPKVVPWENPFDKMELSYEPKPTRPVTRDELERFVKAADEASEGSLGTAAMIAPIAPVFCALQLRDRELSGIQRRCFARAFRAVS